MTVMYQMLHDEMFTAKFDGIDKNEGKMFGCVEDTLMNAALLKLR
jgi:hypothetical protein